MDIDAITTINDIIGIEKIDKIKNIIGTRKISEIKDIIGIEKLGEIDKFIRMIETQFELFFSLLSFSALLFVIFYFLFRSSFFTGKLGEEAEKHLVLRNWLMVFLFGISAVAATYTGTDIGDGVIANSRDVAPLVAGLLGGPLTGIVVGLIGGIHRIFYGGLTQYVSGAITISAGVLGSILYLINKQKFTKPVVSFLIGAGLQGIHMILIVLFVTSPEEGKVLGDVEKLALPMILSNGFGLALFAVLIENFDKENKMRLEKSRVEEKLSVFNSLQMSILPDVSENVENEEDSKELQFKGIKTLLPHMVEENLKAGDVLFKKDDKVDKLYYIKTGCVKFPEIDKKACAGEVIGELGILSPSNKRTSTALCDSDAQLYAITQAKLFELFNTMPQILFELIQISLGRFSTNLKDSITEKQKIEADLNVAARIQLDMLPNEFPPFKDKKAVSLYASMNPARQVGGDFYDFFYIDEEKFGFIIADVSGKGMPASLFMVISKTLLKTAALNGNSPAEVLYNVNNLLYPENDECMFVTVFCAILNVKTGEVEFANGGHNPPLLSTGGEDFKYLTLNKAKVVGISENYNYTNQTLQMKPGDTLFLYTDGVTEAMNPDNELFSDPRLEESLKPLKNKDIREIEAGISEDIKVFVKDAPQSDDITMLVLKYTP